MGYKFMGLDKQPKIQKGKWSQTGLFLRFTLCAGVIVRRRVGLTMFVDDLLCDRFLLW